MICKNYILSWIVGGVLLGIPCISHAQRYDTANPHELGISLRPQPQDRTFRSEAIDSVVTAVCGQLKNPQLRWMFENCFPNTLDTTVKLASDSDSFVITGDIPALWLRDSAAQVWPYLRYCKQDKHLADMIKGLIRRQWRCLLIDPYANAFNECKDSLSPNWQDDLTLMKPGVFERKYELDSQCYPFRLAYGYYQATGDDSIFMDGLYGEVLRLWLTTMKHMQNPCLDAKDQSVVGYAEGDSIYQFMRVTHAMHDTQSNRGKGHPAKPCGLIASSFRPSDDATIYPYLVPSNLMAAMQIAQTIGVLQDVSVNLSEDNVLKLRDMVLSIGEAIEREAMEEHKGYGKVIAYEVDGYGNKLFMDDANIPSLLALPYICNTNVNGYVDKQLLESEEYQATRRFVLSKDNPYYFEGKAGKGIGGPHVGIGAVWPMSIIMQAMTSTDDDEIRECLTQLMKTDGGMGQMHESFQKDNANLYTRSWFAWANTLLGELIIKLIEEGKLDLLNSL